MALRRRLTPPAWRYESASACGCLRYCLGLVPCTSALHPFLQADSRAPAELHMRPGGVGHQIRRIAAPGIGPVKPAKAHGSTCNCEDRLRKLPDASRLLRTRSDVIDL